MSYPALNKSFFINMQHPGSEKGDAAAARMP